MTTELEKLYGLRNQRQKDLFSAEKEIRELEEASYNELAAGIMAEGARFTKELFGNDATYSRTELVIDKHKSFQIREVSVHLYKNAPPSIKNTSYNGSSEGSLLLAMNREGKITREEFYEALLKVPALINDFYENTDE